MPTDRLYSTHHNPADDRWVAEYRARLRRAQLDRAPEDSRWWRLGAWIVIAASGGLFWYHLVRWLGRALT